MNRALAIRTIQVLAKLPEFHIHSVDMESAHAHALYAEEAEHMHACLAIIDDAMTLIKELKSLCETSAESTPAKTEPSRCSGTVSSTPTST